MGRAPMKKILSAGAVLSALMMGALPTAAADLSTRPIYKAPTITPSYYNWTGFYVGGHIGGAWSDKDWTQTFPAGPAALGNAAPVSAHGFIGGRQIREKMETRSWGVGIEGRPRGRGQTGPGAPAPP